MKAVFAFILASALEPAVQGDPAEATQSPPTPVVAQAARSSGLAAMVENERGMVLPANTPVTLTVNDTITTKGNRWHEGDTFDLTVARNVRLGKFVVLPRGCRAVARITWLTDKGAFGKSGKLEFDIEYVEVAGERYNLSGHFRQEGEGNTVATVGAVVAVGVFGALVTGRSGVVPQGRELIARTREDIPVSLPPEALVTPAPETQPAVPRTVPANDRQRLGPRIRCETCR